MDIKVYITPYKKPTLEVPVYGDLSITMSLRGTPSVCSFSSRVDMVTSGGLGLDNGSIVEVRYKGVVIFVGVLFSFNLTFEGVIDFTVYDILRYCQNSISLSRPLENKKGVDLDGLLDEVFGVNKIPFEVVDRLSYSIDTFVYQGSIFDFAYQVIDRTVFDKRFSDGGSDWILTTNYITRKVELRDLTSSYFSIDAVISTKTAQGFSLSSSIDSSTYNYIVLFSETNEDKKAGGKPQEVPHYYPYKEAAIDGRDENIERWGLLTMFDQVRSQDSVKTDLAKNYYSYYCTPEEQVSVQGVLLDLVSAGGTSMLLKPGMNIEVDLDFKLSSLKHQRYIIDTITHTFSENVYTGDIDFVLPRGGVSA